MRHAAGEETPLSLKDAAEYLLEECRMVLPGIQALFGFQLVAVFSTNFSHDLDSARQQLHFAAIVLVAAAVAMIMTPAAFHRQTGTRRVTGTFVRISTRLLLWSMVPLAAAICLDAWIIGTIVLPRSLAAVIAGLLAALFVALWFVLPRVRAVRDVIGGRHS